MAEEKQTVTVDEPKDNNETTTELVPTANQTTKVNLNQVEQLGTHIAMNFNQVEHFVADLVHSDDTETVDKTLFCKTCGDKIKDEETFKQNAERNCKECTKLAELGILKKNKLKFTSNFYNYALFSIVFSPMIWIWITLIHKTPDFFLTIIIAYLIIACFSLFLYIRNLIRYKVISSNKIPLGLIPVDNYVYIMMVCTIISNILICIETLRVYIQKDINPVFECNNIYSYVIDTSISDESITTLAPFEGEYPNECLLYSQLLSNAMLVFVCSFLINLVIMREVKYDGQKGWKQLKQEEIPAFHKVYQFYPKLEKRYYAIHKFKSSAVPTIQMFWKRHDRFSTAWWRSIVIALAVAAFCLCIACNGFFILGEPFLSKLEKQPVMWIPTIISILIAFIMFCLLWTTFYELSWVFNKAFAVMSVCTPPLKDACSLYEDVDVKFEGAYGVENSRASVIMENIELPDVKEDELYTQTDINLNDIKIWWDLRSYGFRTLPLFYEVADPIMSTMVLSVVGLTAYILYELYVTFESDVDTLEATFRNDPIQFMLIVLTGVIIFESMQLLECFLKPYSELGDQISTAKQQVIALQFEIVNEQRNKKRKGYLKECIGLYGKLIAQMAEDKNTKAPRILGFKITQGKLQALQSYIISFLVIFVGSVWESWFGAAHTLSA